MTSSTPQRHVRRIARSVSGVSQKRVAVNTTVISVARADHSTSRQNDYLDEFESATGLHGIFLPTPYNVPRLFQFIEESNIIGQCVESFVTNTAGTGWEVVRASKKIEMDEDDKDELQSIIDFANSEESLTTVVMNAIRHRESVGFGFIEAIRDRKGDLALLRHASSMHMRLGHKIPQEVLVKYDVKRGNRVVTVQEFRKFRRFMQLIAGRVTFFKEFGDPRQMNAQTGHMEGEPGYVEGSPATEIIHLRLPSNDPYGVPRWLAQLPNIIGSREAEEVNMRYFEDNTVPAAMLTVAGGRLTAESHQNLTRLLSGVGLGNDRQNKIVLVEAVGEQESLDGKGTPVQLKVERLADQRPSDALFAQYDEANRTKVRSTWRLPAVATGEANEHNFATANVAMFAAESQVFAPERNKIDEILNNLIVFSRAGLRLRTVKLASRTPAITSPEGQIKTMTALNVMGALTPRMAQKLANTMLQIEIEEYPKPGEEGYEDWMDKPLVLTTGAAKTHDGQAAKTDQIKQTEASGNAAQSQPKHGEE